MAENACARSAAARVIAQVAGGGSSLGNVLPEALRGLPGAQDRAFAQELCYGTLRWWHRLAALCDRLLAKPLKQKDGDVHALLLLGLYQLAYLDVPPHAAVSETVAAAGRLGKSWAKGLTNGVLRSFQRQAKALEAEVDTAEDVALAHPRWLLEALQEAWPQDWAAVAAANNARPPMTLRVNTREQDREAYLEDLRRAELAAHPAPHASAGITLEHPVPVERLPGFREGRVSVQDAAAQLAAHLLDVAPGQRVLDACAAPGGKTCHILERCSDLELVALDQDARRLAMVEENLTRLRLEARLIAADAADPNAWWDGRPFDRILLDAPCSGTGVIRRHPDIKLLRRGEDITALAAEQRRLLHALWPLLKPGGILLYVTCSVLPQENVLQAAAFLREQPEARPLPIEAPWGRRQDVGRQILPGQEGMDGFYYAGLGKR